MDNKDTAQRSITAPKVNFSCMSWAGVLLSIAIIVVRAFQTGAQPIENWSVFSWALMLLPVYFPLLIWIVVVLVALVLCVVSGILTGMFR